MSRTVTESAFTTTAFDQEVTVTVSRTTAPQDNLKPKAMLPRLFVGLEGETIYEQLAARKQRPVKLYRKLALKALTSLGYDTDKVRLRWSQKAGCSCPCSPGFIVEGAGYTDIFVNVAPTQQPELDPPAPTIEVVKVVRESEFTPELVKGTSADPLGKQVCSQCGSSDPDDVTPLAAEQVNADGYSTCCNEPVVSEMAKEVIDGRDVMDAIGQLLR